MADCEMILEAHGGTDRADGPHGCARHSNGPVRLTACAATQGARRRALQAAGQPRAHRSEAGTSGQPIIGPAEAPVQAGGNAVGVTEAHCDPVLVKALARVFR